MLSQHLETLLHAKESQNNKLTHTEMCATGKNDQCIWRVWKRYWRPKVIQKEKRNRHSQPWEVHVLR